MKHYLLIDCPMEKLIPFLRRFAHVPHIAIGGKRDSHIYYLGFDSKFAIIAAWEFAQQNACSAEEVTRDEVIRRFNSDGTLIISSHSNFDPLVHRL